MRLAVYPGSFDPITRGHIDVIDRARAVYDRLVVAVLVNTRKTPTIPVEERAELIRAAIAEELGPAISGSVEVVTYEGLTVDLARERGAASIVRGLRAVSDFESEQAIAHLNRQLAPEVDTVFFMTGIEYAYLFTAYIGQANANAHRIQASFKYDF